MWWPLQNAVVPSCGKWRWLCQVFGCEHGEGGGNGTDDPESADQIFEHVLEDDIMHGKDEDGERTCEGKGPGSPGRDEVQPTKHEADEHGAEQVTDDVDEQISRHNGVAVKMPPERNKLRCAAGQVDIVGKVIDAHERGPGNPANQGQRCRNGSEPGRAPHAEKRHAQVAQGQEEGGSDAANEVQGVAGRTGHRAVDERLAEISRPGDEGECDAQWREDDAGRKAYALEYESGGHRCLFQMRWRSFHCVVPFLCVILLYE